MIGLDLEGIKKPKKTGKQKVPFKRFSGGCPICSLVDGMEEGKTRDRETTEDAGAIT